MVLIREFAISNTDEDFCELLEYFHGADTETLLIIDTYNRIEHIKNLRADYNFFVVFLHTGDQHTGHRKGLYIHDSFDDTAKTFVQDNCSMVVFFE